MTTIDEKETKNDTTMFGVKYYGADWDFYVKLPMPEEELEKIVAEAEEKSGCYDACFPFDCLEPWSSNCDEKLQAMGEAFAQGGVRKFNKRLARYAALDDYERLAVYGYVNDQYSPDGDDVDWALKKVEAGDFSICYLGFHAYDSDRDRVMEEFGRDQLDGWGIGIPDCLQGYIDYRRFGEDIYMEGDCYWGNDPDDAHEKGFIVSFY